VINLIGQIKKRITIELHLKLPHFYRIDKKIINNFKIIFSGIGVHPDQ